MLAMSRVAALAGQAEQSLQFAQRAQSLAPDNPIALTRVVDAYIQLGRLDDAEAVLNQAQSIAPENESVRLATLRFLLVAGRHAELQTMTTQRAQPFINNAASAGSKLHLERLVWAAIGHLLNGDSAGASELLEMAMPSPISLNPHPQSIHFLALLARSRMLEEKDPAAIAEALENGRVTAQRVQDQGWGSSDVDYALAALAAAGGATADALGHLQDALRHGWRGFLFANNDPAMASLHASEEYQALIRQADRD